MNRLLALAVGIPTCTPVTAPAWSAWKWGTLPVPGMHGRTCRQGATRVGPRVGGVSRAQVDVDKRRATVTFDIATATARRLTTAKRDEGYPSTLAADAK